MKLIVKYGLSVGVLLSIWMLFEFLLGLHTEYRHIGRITGYASVLILALGLQKALVSYKKQKGELPFTDAIITGTFISMAAAVVLCGFLLVYYKYLNTDIVDQWQKTAGKGASTGSFILAQLLAMSISTLTGGMMISAVVGFFLRSRTQNPSGNDQ